MYIRCWGSRGSIPVSGRQYIKYGGDTTCLEIRTKSDDLIIIDAGTGIRRLGNKLLKEKQCGINIIFTHAHLDHIMGFPFFKPIYMKDYHIHMTRCPIPKYVKNMLTQVMNPPNFPVKYSDVQARITYAESCNGTFEVGSVTIEPIALSHPNTGSGYKFTEDGKSFVFLTDNELNFVHPGGLPFEAYVDFCADADVLIHDAEYTPAEYKASVAWGHSAYTHALKLSLEARVKKFGLFHLNQERTDKQMDRIIRECNKRAGNKKSSLECFAVASDMEIKL